MNIGQLRQQLPVEDSCRQFFETARQSNSRIGSIRNYLTEKDVKNGKSIDIQNQLI